MPARDLADYRHKRDFSQTPEPGGAGTTGARGPLTFVVHRHEARRLHWDLRLELDGVLMSWAIPRGPSATIGERRLAVRTEDHPLEYTGFEGNIPHGQYGGGSSILWDTGTYSPDEPGYLFDDREAAEAAMRAGLEAGKLSFTLRGTKLHGSWALVKTKTDWLLLKHRDAAANPGAEVTDRLESAVSGRTNDEVEGAWAPRDPGVPAHFSPAQVGSARAGAGPALKPMLASAGKPIPADGWSYEPKLDGMRILASIEDGVVRLVSRGGNDVTRGYPGVVAALERQPVNNAIFDGEVVALDEGGRPSFELLQQRIHLSDGRDVASAEASIPVVYYVFDVLRVDGWDVTRAPLWQRRELLERVLLPHDRVQRVSMIGLPAAEAFAIAVQMGFEGIIAKRDDSRYEAGKRSDTWRKQKATNAGVFSVGGWTEGTGTRGRSFGGLLLGEPRDDGKLDYRGRVGSGFDDRQLAELRAELERLETGMSPFAAKTPEGKDARWTEPEIKVLVEFAERTAGGQLRAPVFKGIADAAIGAVEGGGEPSDDQDGLLEQLSSLKSGGSLRVEGRDVVSTNLDKVMWPSHDGRPAVTKRDLLRYAIAMWPHAEQHLRDRLVTLTRFPNGITGKRFYQKHWEKNRPAFVETVTVYSDEEGGDTEFLLCNNLATLVWLCQLADLEWHVGLARMDPGGAGEYSGSKETLLASILNRPDALLFDLDPYIYRGDEGRGEEPQPSEKGFDAAKESAFKLKDVLDELGLPAFVKTSGATGLHIFVPLLRTLEFDAVRAFAVTLAGELVRRHPKLVTTEWASEKRRGKVFVDANQNARHKALAAAFSPRAHPGAPVSMPLTWGALRKASLGQYHVGNAVDITRRRSDPWAGMEAASVDLEGMLGL